MWTSKKVLFTGTLALAVAVGGASLSYVKVSRVSTVQPLEASLNQFRFLRMINPLASAAESENEHENECNAIAAKGETRQGKSGSTQYPHGAAAYAMGIFNMGSMMLKGTEAALCHFGKSMGMNPDVDAIKAGGSETYEKTFHDQTVTLTVSQGSGYDLSGVVTVNDAQFMRLDWTVDAAGESKGFMSQGTTQMGGGERSVARLGAEDFSTFKRAMHVRWDRTDSTQQSAEFFGTMFGSSYLGENTDRAMYIFTQYNASTKAVTGHAVSIEKRGGGSLGCFRMFFTGTDWEVVDDVVQGGVSVYKTQDSLSSTGESTSATYKDGTNMDGVQLTSLQQANGTGSSLSDAATVATFNKSCNDIFTAATGSTSPFYNNDANFSATAAQIFGN